MFLGLFICAAAVVIVMRTDNRLDNRKKINYSPSYYELNLKPHAWGLQANKVLYLRHSLHKI
jgi:hypothetical protein